MSTLPSPEKRAYANDYKDIAADLTNTMGGNIYGLATTNTIDHAIRETRIISRLEYGELEEVGVFTGCDRYLNALRGIIATHYPSANYGGTMQLSELYLLHLCHAVHYDYALTTYAKETGCRYILTDGIFSVIQARQEYLHRLFIQSLVYKDSGGSSQNASFEEICNANPIIQHYKAVKKALWEKTTGSSEGIKQS